MAGRGNGRGMIAAAGSVVAAALLWSSSYAVTKYVLGEVGPLTIGAVRFTIAAGVLFVVARLRRGRAETSPDARQRRALYLSGLLGITAYFILENIGVELSVASDASLIVATYPLTTMILERVILRTPVSGHRIAGVLIAATGAALVVGNGSEVGGTSRWAGDVLLLVAGLAWAGYNILCKRMGPGQDAVTMTYHQTVAGAAGFLAASLIEIPRWRVPSLPDALLLLYLAAACSVGAFLLYNHGLQRMASSAAVNILNLVPVGGVAGAVLLNGETVRLPQLLGGAVIIAGVSLGMVERAPRHHATPASAPRPAEQDL